MAFQVATRQASQPEQAASQRLVQRRCQACAGEKERDEGHRRVSRRALQAKLHIGEAGDVYEQEADRVANAITRMPGREASRVLATPAATAGGIEAALAGAGQPLSRADREYFEPRFGHDFSHVRVHADESAAESARAIDALAYTVGSDIVFGPGQYAPRSAQGQNLLAHELTHVVQQTAGAGGGHTAQRKLVEHRVTEPSLQARWALDRVTPTHRVDVDYHDENGSTESVKQGGYAVHGVVSTWQTTGFIHQHVGGRAQLAHWVTSHYVFRNDGTTDETLELTAIGQLGGNAKAEDNHYARAGAIVWGGITQRTPANPTPPSRQLFEIHDGGISSGVVNELGQIDVDIPVGENGGSVHITIPLRYVSEGAQAPFSKAETLVSTVAGSISEVDILLGARMSADADIETEFTGIAPWISRNYNNSRAFGRFDLQWRNRPAPGAVMSPATPTSNAGSGAGSQTPPGSRSAGRPDVFRDGNTTSPRIDHVRVPKDIQTDPPDGRDTSHVAPGTGGVSSDADARRGPRVWKFSASNSPPNGIQVRNDHGRHWAWEPSSRMTLGDYKARLRQSVPNWVKNE